MIRAAPWEVLGTSAAAGRSARGRSSGCVRTPKPSQRTLQRWRLAHHSTLASRPWQRSRSLASRYPEWRTGGAVGRKIAAASRRDHLPSARYKLLAVYSARDCASAGGLLSYGPDQIGH